MLCAPLLLFWFSRERGVYCFRVLFWRQTEESPEFSTSQKWSPRDRSVQCLMGNTESLKREIRREVGLSLTTEVRDHGIEFGSADFSLIFLMILAGLARKIGHLHCVW